MEEVDDAGTTFERLNFTCHLDNLENHTMFSNSCDIGIVNQISNVDIEAPVQISILVGSILTVACTLIAMVIFFYFRSFWCDCVAIQIHLTAAHMFRTIMLPIIAGPISSLEFGVKFANISTCKASIILYWYATMSSYIWILILSVHVNCKLSPEIKLVASTIIKYYVLGWITPIPYMCVYFYFVNNQHPKLTCWTGYNETETSWGFRVPSVYFAVWNLGILVNIVWILHTKAYKKGKINDIWRIRHVIKLAKTTLVLSSVQAVATFLVVYFTTNTLYGALFGSLQGVLVAFMCCFCNPEVWKACHLNYRRFIARRNLVCRSLEEI